MYKAFWIVLVIAVLPFAGMGQQRADADLLSSFAASPQTEVMFREFLLGLHKLKFKNEQALIHHIFKQAHKSVLKEYQAYSEYQALFSSGKYDCLTATAFFSLALNDFHIPYSLIETNYHIFLVVHTTTGDVLLETTDKVNGFVTDPDKIQDRIGTYKQNLIASGGQADKQIYLYHLNLYRELSYTQIPGLLYFNQAIKSFNNKEWSRCADLMDKAALLYDSPRMEELASVLIQTLSASASDESEKKKIIARVQRHLVTRSVAGL